MGRTNTNQDDGLAKCLVENLAVMAHSLQPGTTAAKHGTTGAPKQTIPATASSHQQRMQAMLRHPGHSHTQHQPGHNFTVAEQQRWLQQLPTSTRTQAANYLKQHATLVNPRPATANAALQTSQTMHQLAEQAVALQQQMLAHSAEDSKSVASHNRGGSDTASIAPPKHLKCSAGNILLPGNPTAWNCGQSVASLHSLGTRHRATAQAEQHIDIAALHQSWPQKGPNHLCDPKAGNKHHDIRSPQECTKMQTVDRQKVSSRECSNTKPVTKPMYPTKDTLQQLPVSPKPKGYKPVPSELGSHAGWWKRPDSPDSHASYPLTAVTDGETMSPSEAAFWESKVQDLEAVLKDERIRRQRFEQQLKQLQQLAASRGGLTTAQATAGHTKQHNRQ